MSPVLTTHHPKSIQSLNNIQQTKKNKAKKPNQQRIIPRFLLSSVTQTISGHLMKDCVADQKWPFFSDPLIDSAVISLISCPREGPTESLWLKLDWLLAHSFLFGRSITSFLLSALFRIHWVKITMLHWDLDEIGQCECIFNEDSCRYWICLKSNFILRFFGRGGLLMIKNTVN